MDRKSSRGSRNRPDRKRKRRFAGNQYTVKKDTSNTSASTLKLKKFEDKECLKDQNIPFKEQVPISPTNVRVRVVYVDELGWIRLPQEWTHQKGVTSWAHYEENSVLLWKTDRKQCAPRTRYKILKHGPLCETLEDADIFVAHKNPVDSKSDLAAKNEQTKDTETVREDEHQIDLEIKDEPITRTFDLDKLPTNSMEDLDDLEKTITQSEQKYAVIMKFFKELETTAKMQSWKKVDVIMGKLMKEDLSTELCVRKYQGKKGLKEDYTNLYDILVEVIKSKLPCDGKTAHGHMVIWFRRHRPHNKAKKQENNQKRKILLNSQIKKKRENTLRRKRTRRS